jgi:hypothetical protein
VITLVPKTEWVRDIASGTVATPTITPTAGTYTEAPMVTLATATSGATIRYTLDGTAPTANSPRYDVPFYVDATTTVQARAFVSGMTASATASAAYAVDPVGSVATPTLSPGGGRFTTRQAVTVTGPVGATVPHDDRRGPDGHRHHDCVGQRHHRRSRVGAEGPGLPERIVAEPGAPGRLRGDRRAGRGLPARYHEHIRTARTSCTSTGL